MFFFVRGPRDPRAVLARLKTTKLQLTAPLPIREAVGVCRPMLAGSYWTDPDLPPIWLGPRPPKGGAKGGKGKRPLLVPVLKGQGGKGNAIDFGGDSGGSRLEEGEPQLPPEATMDLPREEGEPRLPLGAVAGHSSDGDDMRGKHPDYDSKANISQPTCISADASLCAMLVGGGEKAGA